jgi:hypothetical protein
MFGGRVTGSTSSLYRFGFVLAMTGIAGHLCSLETGAALQELKLFAMHIRFARGETAEVGDQEIAERVAGQEIE